MKLIIGLGNPESKYDGTRHNVGFACAEAFSRNVGASFQLKDKFKAYVAETTLEGEKVIIAKPTTYYNESGLSYRALIDFYKIESPDTLIIHDELALPYGIIRTRTGGSDAGNNGIKSINQHGGESSARIRVGIANELRQQIGDTDFVLGKFSKKEHETLDELTKKTTAHIQSFINDAFEITSFTHSDAE